MEIIRMIEEIEEALGLEVTTDVTPIRERELLATLDATEEIINAL